MEVSFEQRLAAVVKSLPILYDKNLADFKDKNKRQHAWTEVALQLGLPSEKEAEARFTNLRSRYTREKRKKLIQIHVSSVEGHDIQTPSKLDYQAASGSEAYPFMSFLDPYIVSRRTRGNFDSTMRQIQEQNGIVKMEELSNGYSHEDRFRELSSDEEPDALESSGSEQNGGLSASFENCEGSAIVHLPNITSGSIATESEPQCTKIACQPAAHVVKQTAPSRTSEESKPQLTDLGEVLQSKKKRKRVDSLLDVKIEKCVNDCMKSSAQQTVQQSLLKDEDELFGLMVGAQLRAMTPEEKMVAKYHIMSVINQVRMPGVVIKGEVKIPPGPLVVNLHQQTVTHSFSDIVNNIQNNGNIEIPIVTHQNVVPLPPTSNSKSL